MEASELRIGNLVSFTDWPAKDVKIKLNRDNLFMENFIEFFCDPITLTEEWLLRFGFVINTFLYPGKEARLNDFTLWKGDGWDDFVFMISSDRDDDNSIDIKIKHVHQLQNLYHAITGEELILNK